MQRLPTPSSPDPFAAAAGSCHSTAPRCQPPSKETARSTRASPARRVYSGIWKVTTLHCKGQTTSMLKKKKKKCLWEWEKEIRLICWSLNKWSTCMACNCLHIYWFMEDFSVLQDRFSVAFVSHRQPNQTRNTVLSGKGENQQVSGQEVNI